MCNVSILLARFYYSNIRNTAIGFDTPYEELKKIQKIAEYASVFDPLNAEYIHAIANISWFLRDNKKAKKYYLKSTGLTLPMETMSNDLVYF